GNDDSLMAEVIEAMTTNETFFFRDTWPFDTLRDTVLPRLMANRTRTKPIRIWCAAASTGQEPYTIAMILNEDKHQRNGWRFEITATDISSESLNRAREGRYTQFEVQRGLPLPLLVKYFKKTGDFWFIDPSIKAMVQFREFNLLDDFKPLGLFDIVFCRNVLIYFDTPTKADILARIRSRMMNDGALFLGGSETVIGITESFEIIPRLRGVYAAAEARGPAETAQERRAGL
ncbi:MAG: protein-glutamate O-methyltransferase CheR, partial [Rhodospirillales bacterium]